MAAELKLVGAPSPDGLSTPHVPIHEWDVNERPRERFLTLGAAALSDEQLLAVFLRTGVRGSSAVDLARALLKRFGSLRGLLDASATELRGERGIGEARAATILAVSELLRRALSEKARERTMLDSPGTVEDMLRLRIGTLRREVFVALYLDGRHRLIDLREEAHGTLTRVPVFPQEIARHALETHAVSVIVAHNHPSGGIEPSASDRALTRTIKDTLRIIDVNLLDHFVVANNEVCSFAQLGWL